MKMLAIFFWCLISFSILMENRKYFNELSAAEKIFVTIIFFIGGPIMFISGILAMIIDNFFPEGWNDEE